MLVSVNVSSSKSMYTADYVCTHSSSGGSSKPAHGQQSLPCRWASEHQLLDVIGECIQYIALPSQFHACVIIQALVASTFVFYCGRDMI